MCDIQGKIKVLNLNQQVTEKYIKSEVVIITEEKFSQEIMIEFGGDKSDLLDPYKVGEEVKVSTNINGRLWTNAQGVDKYFVSLRGWKVERVGTAAPQQPVEAPPVDMGDEEDDSEIPF